MYNAYFIQHSLYLHHPPPFVLSHCPSYYYSVAFQGRCAQVLQIYGNRKLIDPYFQEKIWPISVLLSTYNLEMLRQIFMLADKSTLREAMLLFWDEDIAFLGHTKWSTKHSENNQKVPSKILDHKFLKLWTYQPPFLPPLSLCTQELIHKHCSSSAYQ